MNCPHCNVSLVMTERSGVEIDYCPKCRGIWLDRGELDKIIERSAVLTPTAAPQPVAQQAYTPSQQPVYQHPPVHTQFGGHGDRHDKHHDGYRKKKSILGELFDF